LQRYSAHPDRPLLVLSGPIRADVLAQLREAPGVWLVTGKGPSLVHEYLPGATVETSLWALNACTLLKLALPEAPATAASARPSPPP
jgi:hypothetical protein